MNSQAPVIAIDGPAAAGKGTVASLVADQLGFSVLDSGLIYRAVAKAVLEAGRDAHDESDVLATIKKLDASSVPQDTQQLAGERVGAAASALAKLPQVRLALLEAQRSRRRPPGLVADGRDMTTVVFPDATVKVFLTASEAERARRRAAQQSGAKMADCLQAIRERDKADQTRQVAPLQRAADAVEIDTTQLAPSAVASRIVDLYRNR